MNIHDYAAFVDSQLGNSQRPLHILAWMAMLEVAESANEVKRITTKDGGILHPLRREKIIEEMGDEFYYFVARMNHLGVTLDEVIETNVKKLEERNGVKPRPALVIYAGYSPVPDMPAAH